MPSRSWNPRLLGGEDVNLLITAGALAGCNTIAGAGQDVEEGGQAVQDAAS
ncbi:MULTISPECIES: entericidin A/B family lipoprotein [Halomonas]|uniref:entericidin A/B family lipoprotein n=1 Tax=Halomonas sp. KX33721 TaxID=1819251 RepID=UPI0020935D59|nr:MULTISPECIES: entericidin A/B family lipoprotein [Halomonas]